ncbi:hypothetical protein SODALDRAFT_327700 [Sodiomyces alkalinus F11]|uniref:C2H2-type domain-containing protein n=1 Tax=Sodiomyces alkalinus (strain CBS 110278 / VKM F-3762 / F11) TaxID=1314773 RepID=A0A3N2Q9Q6_SODAK|nr:hypothetical protein SODALDRAFT_327700 [Sodiomyces alkalinus F11]ROT43504.1 hypothetical protein SODALDRAFT_327700 [Sodiomyces alkalinus F11]
MPPSLVKKSKPNNKSGLGQGRQLGLDSFFRPAAAISTGAGASAAKSISKSSPRKQRSPFPPNAPQTPSGSRIAVVLGSRPRTGPASEHRRVEEDAEDEKLTSDFQVISDLSPQFRRLVAQATQPISIAKPVPPRTTTTTTNESQPPAKRPRGRPKGYRPSLVRKGLQSSSGGPARTASAVASTLSSTTAADDGADARRRRNQAGTVSYIQPKRRGRPPKAPPLKPREVYESLKPNFIRFVCEWERCPAELHNLETLRRHLAVVHARQEPAAGCRYAKCATAHDATAGGHQPPSPGTGVTPTMTEDELRRHLEEVHVPPVLWQAGDGPSVTMTLYAPDDGSGSLPRYLFDKEGNQVTPSVREQKVEDVLTRQQNRRRLKALLLLRDQNLPSEEEDGDEMDEGGGTTHNYLSPMMTYKEGGR